MEVKQLNQDVLRLFGANKQVLSYGNDLSHFILGRIIEHHKDIYQLVSEKGLTSAKVSGKWMYRSQSPKDYPTVGDYVIADINEDIAIIKEIVPRYSLLERKVAGFKSDAQLLAANIDYVCICQSMNHDYNPRRLERYLSMIWSSGATPVVVLTKSDLVNNPIHYIEQTQRVAIGVDVIVSSDQTIDGYNSLDSFLESFKTYVFIGSSGVGKSTIVNHLINNSKLLTQVTGQNDKGRHTTTYRSMFVTSKGSIVIDTPGMRELQLDEGNLDEAFKDIEEIAKSCRFNNCMHDSEPGCAVKEQIRLGCLNEERFANFKKLQKELDYIKKRQKYLELQKTKSNIRSKK
jgi:ribosome biogenesis GTPase